MAQESPLRNLRQVIEEERRRYVDPRRKAAGLPELKEDSSLWGLGFSGGGIRSATFCLGVMQALMSRGLFKRFDYLSTVSGGGYIGSCLSSLLAGRTADSEVRDPDIGLDRDNSPFVGLRAQQEDYQSVEETKLSVRHQMHHLRSHGEYLIPRSGLLQSDFQRFVGAGGLGIFYTVLVFLVAMVLLAATLHLTFSATDPALTHLSPPGGLSLSLDCPPDCDDGWISRVTGFLSSVATAWWTERFVPPLQEMVASSLSHPQDLLGMTLIAIVWISFWLRAARRRAPEVAKLIKEPPKKDQPAGWTASEYAQHLLIRRYNLSSVGMVTAITVLWAVFRSEREGTYLGAFLLPVVFSLWSWITAFLVMSIGDTWRGMRNKTHERGQKPTVEEPIAQARRSLYDSLGGANLLGLGASVALPFVSVLAFSLARLPGKFFTASALAVVGVWVTWRRKTTAIDTSRFLGPGLDLLVVSLLLLTLSRVSELLLRFYRGFDLRVSFGAAGVLLAALAALMFFGYLFDPNRVSPQHFYSDRLAEAYLRTDARVTTRHHRSHLPLATLRNDEQIELRCLGTPTQAPFHLIVAALNLSNSDELVRKRLKSDHFVFSGLYVGSRATGFVPTEIYRGGRTRLATALAVSAAAVASAAGLNTRRSVAFLATLFNARLGMWIENPAWYDQGKTPARPLTFWPTRLFAEIVGKMGGKSRLVNVSDGAHTGDNLGLMPLLERRCRLIVVCDAEADANLDFDSFRNVVRLANVELNIGIDIDLGPIQRHRAVREGYRLSEASVVEGVIRYPAMGENEAFPGRLIYVKSSVSKAAKVASSAPESSPPPAPRMLPAVVASYLRENAAFPHQTTVDQFFDDGQFEAYRALGQYLGELVVEALP